ncbi:cyclic nucleotide-binding domain-containing protein [Methylobacter sp.]|uniref:Crp/Fnr family transcriptional regulator n=1 Tax=Methylobacter sp. TaxID=2051955 RepID=UPI001205FE2B|nr:cyclic nucleotide-binding domain-containing protein [Methylobacter sp.]TAK65107.1 MAG: cyclic nucleotide-binding domain-containing protein [Methylobacter sp.]
MRESLYLEDNDQLVEILKQIPAFKPFKDENLKNMLRLTKLRTFSTSETIIEEGAYEKSMYLLISGGVTISKNNKIILNLKRTGDIFGEMSLLGEEPRSATVSAVSETSCLVIDAEYLDSIDDEGKNSFHAAIYHMFAEILAYRLRVTTEKYTNANQEIERLKNELELLKRSGIVKII